jgi:ferredoxin--NADP+ reductase
LSIIKDPETYIRFERVVLVHGVRRVSELAYRDVITEELPSNEFFGEDVRKKLIYYPTVTREPYQNRGRMTEVIESGRLFKAIGLPPLDAAADRFMVCGSPSMLKDVGALLDANGFSVSPHVGTPGHYVIERAFVER